jgi:hypothetical protein
VIGLTVDPAVRSELPHGGVYVMQVFEARIGTQFLLGSLDGLYFISQKAEVLRFSASRVGQSSS